MIKFRELSPRYHIWTGWVVDRTDLKPCIGCRKKTTGSVKDARAKSRAPLCGDCARKRGL